MRGRTVVDVQRLISKVWKLLFDRQSRMRNAMSYSFGKRKVFQLVVVNDATNHVNFVVLDGFQQILRIRRQIDEFLYGIHLFHRFALFKNLEYQLALSHSKQKRKISHDRGTYFPIAPSVNVLQELGNQ